MSGRDKTDTGEEALASEMSVTFGAEELAEFFDGFQSIEEIARALCAPLGDGIPK